MKKEVKAALHRISKIFKVPFDLVRWAYIEDRKYYDNDQDALYGMVEALQGDKA